jgi:excinuclease ABC subunit B
MKEAIEETDKRRELQLEYNRLHDLKPSPIVKAISSGIQAAVPRKSSSKQQDIEAMMLEAAERLDFEEAARLRDQLSSIRRD